MGRLINSIVAVCPNMGIGNKGNLPWHPVRLSKEFRHFQKMTSTPSVEGKCNAVIMGRKTWFSIPEKNRPLKNRINIVLSRELKELPDGAHYLARDLDSALDLLDSSDLQEKVDLVWIIGGSALYKIQESLQMLEIQSNTHKMLERLSRSTVGSGNQLERSLLHFYAVILSTHFHDQIITQCIGVVQDKIIRKCKSYRESAQEKSEQSMLQAETLQQDRREAAVLANDKLEEEALESPASHRLFVTRILQDFESDTFMPEINLNKFKLLPEFPDVPTGIQEEKGIQFKYEVYERITSA